MNPVYYGKEKEKALRGPMATLGVVFNPDVHRKIMHWIHRAPGEVSGLGKIEIDNGTFRVVDAVLIKQRNSGTSTDLDPESVAMAMYEMRDQPGHLNFWWHSHVNMGVFWSGTDIDTIREIGRQGFVVATVLNKRGEMRSAFYLAEAGFMPEVFVDELSTVISAFVPQDIVAAWNKDYDDKCTPIYSRGWPRQGELQLQEAQDAEELKEKEAATQQEDATAYAMLVNSLDELEEEMRLNAGSQQVGFIFARILKKINDAACVDGAEAAVLRQYYAAAYNQVTTGESAGVNINDIQ